MRFRATLEPHGKAATGFVVPAEVIEDLGGGRRPAVRVTIRDHVYRSTIASRGDRFLLGVSAENREAAGVAAGDTLDVNVDLDTEPREVDLPPDLAAALAAKPGAERFFSTLTASQQSGFVTPIEQAKQPETRQRRIEKAVAALREGRKR